MMDKLDGKKHEINENGLAVINGLFDGKEIDNLITIINEADAGKPTFRKTGGLFAIRQFLNEVPGVARQIFTEKLKNIISALFGRGYFVVKSIYFDKPPLSNWFVTYHQDLTISVATKHPVDGFVNWTLKQGRYALQPPVEILQDNFTVRIHLDDTDESNGALRVMPGSHKNGVISQKDAGFSTASEMVCAVKKGGIMIMGPLVMHASCRTLNNKRRRVVHIEFSRTQLPAPLGWGEKQIIEWQF